MLALILSPKSGEVCANHLPLACEEDALCRFAISTAAKAYYCVTPNRELLYNRVNMTNQSITELIKPPRVVGSSESIRRAAGIIHASEGSWALVIKGGQVIGGISEHAIASHLALSDDPEITLDQPAEGIVEPYPLYINPMITRSDAARIFSESGLDVLPVVDNFGGLRGMLYRTDVVAVLTSNLRPATVGGMATPLGVYLTTGNISGGAGSLGLYLTGITLGLMMIISRAAGDGAMSFLNKLIAHKLPVFMKTLTGIDAFGIGSLIISVGLLILLLKLSPLAGYHGAEHMTVHAIESGDDLTLENVRRYPRVHPRCGTNLLGAAAVFILITSQFSGEIAVLVAIGVVMLGRKTIGDWMQTVFTTKSPSDHQLASAIAAGKEILKRYHDHPGLVSRGFSRIWKMGFLQAAAGMTTVLAAVYCIERLTHKSLLF